MNKKQLWIIYGVLCFLLIWGWDLIDTLKFKGYVDWKQVLSPFNISQFLYMGGTFWLTRYLFKKYYPAKKYGKVLLSIVGLFLFFITLRYLLEQVIFPYFFDISNYSKNVHIVYFALDNLYYASIYIILGTLVFLLDHQIDSQKKQAILQQESVQAQLAFLRSQVSPHFLFNSLNNIYSLSYKKSDKAPDAILKLSELTRYMLYEKQDSIAVEKEWDYIENFISLQQLRYEVPLQIKTHIVGNTTTVQIAPYLLIPFVENAFKHGDVQDANKPLTIELFCTEREINFSVKNKIGFQQKDKDGGIGLENVRKRLQLIYGNNHELLINKQDDIFETRLKITTHAH